MPVSALNNATVLDGYVDALTVDFGRGRPSFSMQVFNAGVYYQLALYPRGGRDLEWEPGEHFLGPSLNSFRDPKSEGFPEDREFGGVRVRNSAAGVPASVTVA